MAQVEPQMKALKWIVASAVVSLSLTAIAAQPGNITVSHYESLQRLDMRAADTTNSRKPDGSGPVALSFDALGKTFDLQLEPNSRFLGQDAQDAMPEDIQIYRGELAGSPGSWARIVVFEGVPRGMFFDGNEMYVIEAPGDSLVNAIEPVIYRLADTLVQSGTMSCGSESLSGNGAVMYSRLVGDLGGVLEAVGASSEISIGAIGDFEFTSAQGGDSAASAAIVDRMNMVDGIYSQGIGVQIVVSIETFSSSNDPFSDVSESGALLGELTTYRQNTPAQNNLGLTHLWTGRNLDGPTVGIAWDDTLCRSGIGSGLSEGNSSAAFDSLIAAHEIGHNFGAPHDGDAGGACSAEPLNYIMAPSLSLNRDTFSPCSIGIMQASAAAASCVTTLATVDMGVVLSGQPSNVFLTNSPELTVDLNNNGATQATNVALDITLPNNVTFVSAVASAGNCTNGAGTVNCQIGDVPGLSGRTVTLTTTASAIGTGSFDAIVSADVDEQPGNNQSSVQLTVNPAVDLVINSPTAATINVNASTTQSALIQNISSFNATGLSLSVSLNNGLRADSASWPIGTCTVTAQQIDCLALGLASQADTTLTIGVTGLSAGARSYTVTLSSSEPDANTSDNTLTGSISVVDPSNNDDSGGGAIGLPFLLMLGSIVFVMRRRIQER
jgi:uncharacterized repeat protein (TIGR01451 family)